MIMVSPLPGKYELEASGAGAWLPGKAPRLTVLTLHDCGTVRVGPPPSDAKCVEEDQPLLQFDQEFASSHHCGSPLPKQRQNGMERHLASCGPESEEAKAMRCAAFTSLAVAGARKPTYCATEKCRAQLALSVCLSVCLLQ